MYLIILPYTLLYRLRRDPWAESTLHYLLCGRSIIIHKLWSRRVRAARFDYFKNRL